MREDEIFDTLRHIRLLAFKQKNLALIADAERIEKLLRTEMQTSEKQSGVQTFAVTGGRLVM